MATGKDRGKHDGGKDAKGTFRGGRVPVREHQPAPPFPEEGENGGPAVRGAAGVSFEEDLRQVRKRPRRLPHT